MLNIDGLLLSDTLADRRLLEVLAGTQLLTLAKIHPKQLFRISGVDQRCDGLLFRS